ncbi:plastocyanin/azurin family copper-binding protein [Mesorhizobium opportunistum]|uniref:cupredoxin domain-containing protein n=1 Tax=Mesorhizobium TaxID=68287 RepID=UPI0003CE4183|nr:plastocyanin/azurin family copper-binding protein [Mesorhizobium sp. LNHC229A00]ESY92769.1 amicyanin [Mesorhizobium sp. LNHC229A00]
MSAKIDRRLALQIGALALSAAAFGEKRAFADGKVTQIKVVKSADGSMGFDPKEVTITAGDTVEWSNETTFEHTVTPDADSTGKFEGTDSLKPKQKYSTTIKAPADPIHYHCDFHPTMKGMIIVK